MEKKFTFDNKTGDYVIRIPRDMFQGRLETITLITIAKALSVDGLKEAAAHLLSEADGRGKPSIIDQMMHEMEKKK